MTRPSARGDELLAGVTAFVLGTGTTIVFLGVGPYVYHEAILWGVALGVRRVRRDPGVDRAAAAAACWWRPGVLTLLALLSRLAVGIGPAAALAMLAVAVAVARVWPASRAARSLASGLATDGLGWGVVGCVGRRGRRSRSRCTPWSTSRSSARCSACPTTTRRRTRSVPGRRAILAANGGTLVNLDALPTNLVQYLRPDAVRLDGAWPWVRLPSWRPSVIGDLRYDMLDHTSSVTAAMPVLFVLAVGGVVGTVRAGARVRLRPPSVPSPCRSLGAACAVVPSLVFVYITPRYTADFLPLLVLSAFAGLYAFVALGALDRGRAGAWWSSTSIVLGVLALLELLANVSMARDYQLGREQVRTFVEPDADGRDGVRGGACGTPGAGTWRSTDMT